MKLWLDDMRCRPEGCPNCMDVLTGYVRPMPEGYTHVTHIAHAKVYLRQGDVTDASLDHDLGACTDCLEATIGHPPPFTDADAEWLEKTGFASMPHCEHVGNGYQLVLWMAEQNVWPTNVPLVHSQNADRARMMRDVIRKFHERN